MKRRPTVLATGALVLSLAPAVLGTGSVSAQSGGHTAEGGHPGAAVCSVSGRPARSPFLGVHRGWIRWHQGMMTRSAATTARYHAMVKAQWPAMGRAVQPASTGFLLSHGAMGQADNIAICQHERMARW